MNRDKKSKLMIFGIIFIIFFIIPTFIIFRGTYSTDTEKIVTVYVSNSSELNKVIETINTTTDKYKIILTNDIKLDSYLQIGSEDSLIIPNIILDLQSYYIISKDYAYDVEGFGQYAVEYGLINYGNLEINATTGGIRTSSSNVNTLTDVLLVNNNYMVINGGNYYDGATVGAPQVLINYGELEINGGTFTKKKNDGIIFSNYNESSIFRFNGGSFISENGGFSNNGKMIMNGGTIKAGTGTGIVNNNYLQINNGTIESHTNCIKNGTISSSGYDENIVLIINDGLFSVITPENNASGTPTHSVLTNGGKININGGNYTITNNYDNIRISVIENYGIQNIEGGLFVGETSYSAAFIYGVRNIGNISSTTINGGLFKLKYSNLAQIYKSNFFNSNVGIDNIYFKENYEYVLMENDGYKIAQLSKIIVGSDYFSAAEGDGSIENPYQISTVEQLNAIRYLPTNHYILVNDLYLEYDTTNVNGKFYNNGLGWDPIGDNLNIDDVLFTGSLDGNYHKIYGLNINRPNEKYVGLFGASKGNISNIAIVNSNIIGSDYVGSLVGYSWADLSNIYTVNNVRGNTFIGGIVGNIGGNKITNSYNLGNIVGNQYVGGLAGQTRSITYCYNTGIVTGIEKVSSLAGYSPSGNVGLHNNEITMIDGRTDKILSLDNSKDIYNTVSKWDLESTWEIEEINKITRLPKIKKFDFDYITEIVLTTNNSRLSIGDSIEYKILPSNDYNRNIVFFSEDSNVVSISDDGVITELNDGYTTISLISLYDGYKLNISAVVKNKELSLVRNNYIVTYVTNGGNIASETTEVTYGELYKNLLIPERKGYVFLGWYLDESFQKEVTSDTIVSIDSNHSLYAKWELDTLNIENTSNYKTKNDLITNFSPGILADDVDLGLDNNYLIKKFDKNNIEKNNSIMVTGDRLKIYLDELLVRQYIIVIKGDVNSDGIKNINDIKLSSKHIINGNLIIEAANLNAIDMDDNDYININDIVKMVRNIKK